VGKWLKVPASLQQQVFFHLGVYSALLKNMCRYILKVFLPEVNAISFGDDVKPSVLGYW